MSYDSQSVYFICFEEIVSFIVFKFGEKKRPTRTIECKNPLRSIGQRVSRMSLAIFRLPLDILKEMQSAAKKKKKNK